MTQRLGKKPVAVIGYSGHAFVLIDIFSLSGREVTAYCDELEKEMNPYNLTYLGKESNAVQKLSEYDYFASVGNNVIREKIQTGMTASLGFAPLNAIHPSAIIAGNTLLGKGVMIGARVVINPQSRLGDGVICNTGVIVEHECSIGKFAHIAPGTVLCGDVNVGDGTFIGANSVVRQGIRIGKNVTIGAGSVVIKDVPDNVTVMGNPAREVLT